MPLKEVKRECGLPDLTTLITSQCYQNLEVGDAEDCQIIIYQKHSIGNEEYFN